MASTSTSTSDLPTLFLMQHGPLKSHQDERKWSFLVLYPTSKRNLGMIHALDWAEDPNLIKMRSRHQRRDTSLPTFKFTSILVGLPFSAANLKLLASKAAHPISPVPLAGCDYAQKTGKSVGFDEVESSYFRDDDFLFSLTSLGTGLTPHSLYSGPLTMSPALKAERSPYTSLVLCLGDALGMIPTHPDAGITEEASWSRKTRVWVNRSMQKFGNEANLTRCFLPPSSRVEYGEKTPRLERL
ncbi:hypothetical protein DFP72DRAFT_846940 [Ephemerocybe angulata]|uniref:Uncharacterized protein n=1 Tax=Ephemerocybe angulata TaxID=980116 RepID=A0A8H6HZK9_9AGAR|nr:hypothetical protein DFP72DRAFT_846940 [Tulosesus angulatus]